MLELVSKRTDGFIKQMPKYLRKRYGQFFTSLTTARFMASLFTLPVKRDLQVLDAGSGSGMLSVALLERMDKELEGMVHVHLTCYENDTQILPLLKENLNDLKKELNLQFDFEIRTDDYLLSQSDAFNGSLFKGRSDAGRYDMIIGNPPYLKIPRDAPEAIAMHQVCYGAPNLYFLFASMGIFNLCDKGQMVYIMPRSWTSGAYFKRFREFLLDQVKIEHIHLFNSRNRVFNKENVLQETMIVKFRKTKIIPDKVFITTTHTDQDFEKQTHFPVSYTNLVSGKSRYVYLITNTKEAEVVDKLNVFPYTLPNLGLRMKTGLVVDFRARNLLRDFQEKGVVPLIYSRHISGGRVQFPVGNGPEFLVMDKRAFLQRNKNYLFVKRFTSKEEHRRLQCGIYLGSDLPEYEWISTQNKVNFIDGNHNLTDAETYGLFVLFNSRWYDLYYRVLNGSTQVNATEMNQIPVPSLPDIRRMGLRLLKKDDLSEDRCDEILKSYLNEQYQENASFAFKDRFAERATV